MGPFTIGSDFHQTLKANLAYAGGHTPSFHLVTFGQGVKTLNPRVTSDTFLGNPSRTTEHRFFVRTLLNAFFVTTAPGLIDQDDTVLLTLVDRFTRTSGQTTRIRAVVTNPLQIEKPDFMLG